MLFLQSYKIKINSISSLKLMPQMLKNGTPLQYMALWYKDYFDQKIFEK